jgi:replicative DNA helicase
MLYDKKIATQLLGAIIKKPSLFGDTDGFLLSPDDFDDRLHRIIFTVLYNLYFSGMVSIDVSAVNEYLKNYPDLYKYFNDEKGSDFFLAAAELADLENISYYYDTIKKYALLRDLKPHFNISEWYTENALDFTQREKVRRNFEESTLKDIVNSIQVKLMGASAKHNNRKNFASGDASDDIEELLEDLKKNPEVGYAFEGDLFTTVVRGARRTKFYLGSGATAAGKTRHAVGNACRLAYPIRYDSKKDKWVNTGSSLRSLVVTTELELVEIKTMVLAYLTAINEEKILNYNLTEQEEQRLSVAVKIMKHFEGHLTLFHMPDPSVTQVNTNLRQTILVKNIDAVFFDYIHTSPQLLSDFGGIRVRDDLALLMLSTSLKNLANEMNVIMWSGTQLNKEGEEAHFVDSGGIRGSRAIGDKTDAAFVYRAITPDMAKLIAPLVKQTNSNPNICIDVYKVRRGKLKRTRIFRESDLGTLRVRDCFVTDEYFNPISVEVIFAKHKDSILTEQQINEIIKIEQAQAVLQPTPRQFKVSL